jgi:hypothetical protein|tara:strand:+ start:853 stop:1368 length:516 start_codon:yes stop_codon:yes gene_type:complete
MNQLLNFDESRVRDISREPKVRNKATPREVTHTITMVPPNYTETLWPDVREQLLRAIDRSKGRWTEEALFKSIVSGHQHLWLAFDADHNIDGVGTTELVVYPGKKMLTIQFLGGDRFNDWVWDMLERFTDWARDNNCDGIEATARMGFWKWLQQDGFQRSYVVYERSLNDG